VFFAVAGGILAAAEGSLYYVLAGLAMIVSGLLSVRNDRRGAQLYILVWIATLLWAVSEVGFAPFQLMPRVVAPTVLVALVIGLSLLDRRSTARFSFILPALAGGVALTFMGALLFPGHQTGGTISAALAPFDSVSIATNEADNDWKVYGGTLSGRRYSALSDITPANVGKLELAWTHRSGDLPNYEEVHKHTREVHSEATPIHIGNVLYTCAPHGRVQAIDDTTGKTIWTYVEKPDRAADPYLVCRGVAYYEAPVGAPCPHRIFAPVYDAYVVAVDADTGQLCQAVGHNGKIDLHEGMGENASETAIHQISSSAPTIINDRVVVGERIDDGVDRIIGSGVVRGYDANTGTLAWAWDVGRSEDSIPSLPAGEIFTPGTPNVWGWISGDTANGIIYLPTGNSSPDYYNGMRRPFDDKFSDSIVALDAQTGKLRWSRQLVHHDMWDMDVPVGPSLFDYHAPDGQVVPAMIQTTKLGQVYFLNRLTGAPISPIAELPVSTRGAAPGQIVSPTQPYSVGMPSFTPKDPTEIGTWGATPIDQLICRIELRHAQATGAYKPVGLTPIIGHPAFNGVSDWGGAAIDPVHGIMTINTMEVPFKLYLAQRNSREGRNWIKQARPGENAANTLVATQFNTPYIGLTKAWVGIFGAPCLAPPWGRMTAVDLNTRRVIWNKTLGTAQDTGLFGSHFGVPLKIGVPNIAGSIITGGGLVFIGATTDQYLRAFDERTGQEIWSARLPAGPQATPMTYRGRDGRQYVVITAGGHGAMGTRFGDYTMAFALPK